MCVHTNGFLFSSDKKKKKKSRIQVCVCVYVCVVDVYALWFFSLLVLFFGRVLDGTFLFCFLGVSQKIRKQTNKKQKKKTLSYSSCRVCTCVCVCVACVCVGFWCFAPSSLSLLVFFVVLSFFLYRVYCVCLFIAHIQSNSDCWTMTMVLKPLWHHHQHLSLVVLMLLLDLFEIVQMLVLVLIQISHSHQT